LTSDIFLVFNEKLIECFHPYDPQFVTFTGFFLFADKLGDAVSCGQTEQMTSFSLNITICQLSTAPAALKKWEGKQVRLLVA